mmetsp:Transcript_31059/g.34742  ORF Transcript_31059/g.34742 Transcript_31059/m.34742 type:complete len:171 (-) Transcript_31059:412-924(-)
MNNSERMEPSNRWRRSSTRENSEFKWKHDHSVVGALEVALEPNIDLRAEMIQHNIVGYDDEFGKFLKVWEGLQKKEFITAFESIPPTTTCFGKVTMQDQTIKHNVGILNKGWVKSVNERVNDNGNGFKISIYVWQWSNISGKAETIIPMVRFHSLGRNQTQTKLKSNNMT